MDDLVDNFEKDYNDHNLVCWPNAWMCAHADAVATSRFGHIVLAASAEAVARSIAQIYTQCSSSHFTL